MKYFLDTEFLEGPQKKTLFGFKTGLTKPTIDIISIGIVSEDGRELYAISKDFNLKEAWNRYEIKHKRISDKNTIKVKEYWIRENVLKSIFNQMDFWHRKDFEWREWDDKNIDKRVKPKFTLENFTKYLNIFGKTNDRIAREVLEFTLDPTSTGYKKWLGSLDSYINGLKCNSTEKPSFYAYYADYDWVVFCWLFGRMIELPKGFPMYCIDLKQLLDDKAEEHITKIAYNTGNHTILTLKESLKDINDSVDYPKKENEHNALDDARWNRRLFDYLNSI